MTYFPSQSVTSYDGGSPFDVVMDNSGPNNAILYEGTSYPGTADTVGVLRWRIRKFFYDGNNMISGWRWADGTTEMSKDWSQRSFYSYVAL